MVQRAGTGQGRVNGGIISGIYGDVKTRVQEQIKTGGDGEHPRYITRSGDYRRGRQDPTGGRGAQGGGCSSTWAAQPGTASYKRGPHHRCRYTSRDPQEPCLFYQGSVQGPPPCKVMETIDQGISHAGQCCIVGDVVCTPSIGLQNGRGWVHQHGADS